MKKNKLVPRLRFKPTNIGHTAGKDDNGNAYPDWIEKKLGEVLDYEQPTRYLVNSTEYDDKNKIPVLTAGKSFILGYTYEKENIFTKVPVIIFDDFTMATQFVDFPFKAKSSAMKILRITSINFNIKFIYESIQQIKYLKGDEHKRFWISEYSKIKIYIPSSQEQTKIANFLSLIDKKIEKIGEKKRLLEEYKKGVMQKIFSQKIRFKPDHTSGKNDNGNPYPDWIEKKLGELCDIRTGKLDANAMVPMGKYRFYTCAKNYYYIDNYEFDTNALIISGNGANVGYIHHYQGKFNAYQRTYVLDKFKNNILYLKYFLDCFLYKRIIKEKKEGNTPYIIISTLSNMRIFLPFKNEQTKIADFLSAIDKEIELINKQIEQTKTYKKGLLQQMFV